jgi:hypothetical protein
MKGNAKITRNVRNVKNVKSNDVGTQNVEMDNHADDYDEAKVRAEQEALLAKRDALLKKIKEFNASLRD